MKGKLYILVVVLLSLLVVFAFANATGNIKYGGVVKFVEPQGPLTFNLNPFSPVGLPTAGIIYEPLFAINFLNGDVTPMLGTSYQWTNNNCDLIVKTRENVKWSDGTPFTAKDVAFTFNYIKQYPALDTGGQWASLNYLQSVEASGDNTVIFKFSKPNVADFYSLSQQIIIPQHIWSNISDPTKYLNTDPVGTGPFLFKSFSSANGIVTYVKNPHYWMSGKPYIDGFEWRSIESNSTGLLMMLKGEADWAWISVPNPLSTWVSKSPDNEFFSPQVAYNYLFLNTQKSPLNNPIFRKAIALAIDKENINKKVYYNIAGIANSTGIIPSQQKEWLDPTLQTLSSSLSIYNPDEAIKLLESIGYKKDPSTGMFLNPDGKPMTPLQIIVAAGYTDYITASQLISYDLQKIGIPTIVQQESPGAWYSSLLTGQYDMSFTWTGSTLGPTPYYMYYHLFAPQFSAPIGQAAMSNWSRYTNPLIDAALGVYTSTTDLHLQKQAIYTIERIVLDDMPIIPLVGAPMWNFYSTRQFTGWPTEENDYDPVSVSNPGLMEQVLLRVHLK